MVNHNLFNRIISLENLLVAWREFRRGKLKKFEVQEFSLNLEDNLFSLHEELLRGAYSPGRYFSFYVRDPKLRPIHKASVKDRLVFQSVFRVLYHFFDKKFIYYSYSCRFKKDTHKGVERLTMIMEKVSKNYHDRAHALKCDIKQFFYSVDHGILFSLIKKEVKDAETLNLVFKIIDSFHRAPGKGLPLGNVTSQLFANIYLNELDQYVKHVLKEKYYLRYCDDLVIIGLDQSYLLSLVPKLNKFLQNNLSLSLHPKKIKVRKLRQGIDFLGYIILPHYRGLRTKTKKRMFRKMKQKIEQHNLGLLNQQSLNQSLQSYLGLLKHCRGYKIEQQLLREIIFSDVHWRSK